MADYWKDVLPVDPYTVKSRSLLQDIDRQILTQLYQPLIGSFAFSLYMTLWGELEQNRLWGTESTHRQLMGMTQSNLKKIHHEQGKLEGIGLLKVYIRESEQEERKFIYELLPPLRPNEFFEDGMLNVFLYNRVGKTKYQQLRQFYTHPSVSSDAKEITRPFNHTFESFQPSEWKLTPDMEETMELAEGSELASVGQAPSYTVTEEVFDFELFLAGLSETMIPRKAITQDVRECIKKLSYLYGIDPISMQHVAMTAINEQDAITVEALRRAASDWYQIERNGQLPDLIDKTQPVSLRENGEKDSGDSLDAKLIAQLETISPRKLLQDIADGTEPSKADLKIIADIMFEQKLEPGVTNVLIYYVMLKTDMKLSKNYIQKIASHWARKKVKTVREAMKLAIEEHRQYLDWAEGKTNRTAQNKKTVREEKRPDWLKEEEAGKKADKPLLSAEDLEEQKKKMMEEMKKLKKYSAY
ncbi:replication initiation and membrane attachment family protein [Bacillus sp. ISL-51]|uniref:replication initiation and membrane attachment family protein n=1 Tax=unclassified Bacillus (in: firmicutes) TaxID=185979 RepID=UPI001BE4EE95|nr:MULTISPECIES: replication initiation and membrane attachment family protein [unclassified Bacillus (in: firmicutes)]MBT2574139.1 replication initiation and membrane attachment family protein [Bacillus sp. ISL-51]MBT2636089.1 replication initiation and membrane attachment family protein [Bacillus sp. ISL-26]